MKKFVLNRRDFFSTASILGVGGAVNAGALLSSCSNDKKASPITPLSQLANKYTPDLVDSAIDGKPLKAGLVGCGGRGSGASFDFLEAGQNLQIVSLGDVFKDKIDTFRERLKKYKNIDIKKDMCFVGFDSYKKVLDTDIDIVILATPPAFRPVHFEAAVEAGKHIFMEKPVCIDPVGYRTILTNSKKADHQGLCVVTGTHRRHSRLYVESFKKIRSGLIGEIVSGTLYYLVGGEWFCSRQKGWSDMEWMIRDQVNWRWLSGDYILDTLLHNIDVFNWLSGRKPESVNATGARLRRLSGDNYDLFNVDYEYEGNVQLHGICRCIDGCKNMVNEKIIGTRGIWKNNGTIHDLKGNLVWQFDREKEKQEFKQTNPYVLEHVDLINHIRSNQHVNYANDTANSCLTAIMGRESAYTGNQVLWEDMCNSQLSLMPEKLEMGAMNMADFVPPTPGEGQNSNKDRRKNLRGGIYRRDKSGNGFILR